MASVVGLISIEIFGYTGGEEARGYAADLGIALQLTNILRDVRKTPAAAASTCRWTSWNGSATARRSSWPALRRWSSGG